MREKFGARADNIQFDTEFVETNMAFEEIFGPKTADGALEGIATGADFMNALEQAEQCSPST